MTDGSPAQRPDRAALARLLAPVRTRIRIAVVAQVAAALAAVVPFVAVAELGRLLLGGGAAAGAWPIVWVALGALAARFVLFFLAGGLTHLADADLQLDLRRRMATRLGQVPLGWFGARNSGTVKKALQDDVTAMHHLVAHSLLDLTAGIVTPVAALAYLVWVDWRMTLVTLLPVAAGLYFYARSMAGYGENMVAYDQALGRINGSAVEFVNGIAVVKTFGQSRKAHQRFTSAADDFATFFLDWVGGVTRISAIGQILLSPVVVLLVVLTGGTVFVTNGWLAPADVLPFALLGLGITAPITTLAQTSQQLRSARLAAAQVAAVLGTEPLPAPEAEAADPADGRVSLRNVHFGYTADTPVLRGIDLELAPGTVTALVGPSGGGKSTLAKLLPRFFDVTDGSVSIGGVDIRDLSAEQLYRRVSFVLQDVQLLRATVADNIRLAVPEADQSTVEAAARAAQIHQRILELPRGYDSVIGEDARFSGGEAQRVSIARALLADAPILVLDEATAFADPESESAIQQALSTLVAGRTLLVIAHRLSTVAEADQIAVLADGRVAELGTHLELLARQGLYARMWAAHERAGAWQPHTSPLETR
ncbi:ABC transporter ATP-binding protein/permease [Crossiella sp. SN42]|uniref:ABC transporter ATP-binding protein n=1 Tax=Crossiella sp. SN42 TaxID=2944808 RepID=UPI00207D3F74|nr:ABC transporter ATP-binding protein [Crossiella sp. SN42]MCO1574877.1 ABC transporter ATP-binding protein/permease [Crossiella sp. SN42]